MRTQVITDGCTPTKCRSFRSKVTWAINHVGSYSYRPLSPQWENFQKQSESFLPCFFFTLEYHGIHELFSIWMQEVDWSMFPVLSHSKGQFKQVSGSTTSTTIYDTDSDSE